MTIPFLRHAISAGHVTIHNDVDSSEDLSAQIEIDSEYSRLKDTELGLNSIVFVPTFSSEDGIHYICRKGFETIAYFGVSEVYYGTGDTFLRINFPSSKPVVPIGEEPLDSVTNFLFGNDPNHWQTGLTDCKVLRYADIYPGIDLMYKFTNGDLKYEFVVAPNADPRLIKMNYLGAETVDVHSDHITVSNPDFSFTDTGLWAYQENVGIVNVDCSFKPLDENTIGFQVGQYEESQELIIDPILIYSTLIGGISYDKARAITVDNEYIYITGETRSANFPTVNAYNSTYGGNDECFVIKLTADGQSIIYSTFLGGTGNDYCMGIAVESGYAYITGYTDSYNFPTVNAYNSTRDGNYDCFMAKLASDGQSLLYCTLFGGVHSDFGDDIAVENGYAYVTGNTFSPNFPTVNAYNSTHGGLYDCFATKFATDGQSLVYSTLLGGVDQDRGEGITVENGYAYITGYTESTNYPTKNAYDSIQSGSNDGFVTKLALDGQSLNYSTFLGDTGDDRGLNIALEDNYVYVTGMTSSDNFPIVNASQDLRSGSYDSFVTKFAINGQSLIYSTFLGGTDNDYGNDIAVENGYAYITGQTFSLDFPTVNAYDWTANIGGECFVVKVKDYGQSLVYSTLFGGQNTDNAQSIAVMNGSVFITGFTYSKSFPTVNAYDFSHNGYDDCFLSIFIEDSDADGLSDNEEAKYGTNPFCIDTDNDNFLDGYEVEYGSDPLDPMSYPSIPQAWYESIYEDLDGNASRIEFVVGLVSQNTAYLQQLNASVIGNITEIREILDQLGIAVGDSDYDGLDDLDEITYGTDILCIDTDCDNLNDAFEIKIGTDPLDDDSDSDTYLDGVEVLAGTDPLDDSDYPGVTGTTTSTTPTSTTTSLIDLETLIIPIAITGVIVIIVIILIKRRK